MTADTLTVPLPDYFSRIESHFLREFAEVVEDWSRCVNALTAWEDEHLLDDPAPQNVAPHKQTVERLLRFGRLVSLAIQEAEFPDRKTSEIVAATQSCLKDKLALSHGPKQTEQRREEILKACFNEPELERLLAAFYERDTCEPSDRPKWDATVQRLINDALSRQPEITRDQFMDALQTRYREFRRARRKPPTLPPSA